MLKPNIKYKVTLTEEERKFLRKLIEKGKTAGHKIRHAQILLALDEIPENEHWTDTRVGEVYGCRPQAVGKLRKRFVEQGFEAALERKKRETPSRIKINGEAEARIIALTCSSPPEGRAREPLNKSAVPPAFAPCGAQMRLSSTDLIPIGLNQCFPRWTLKLLAQKTVELGILDSISDHGIGNLLKKTKLNHGYRSGRA